MRKTIRRPREPRLEKLRERVISGPGHLDAAVRRAAYEGGPVPEALETYVDKVRRHAYRVVDADISELQALGYSDDEIFELTVAVALGAGLSRFDRARRAIEAAE